jgi:hypothetical protein
MTKFLVSGLAVTLFGILSLSRPVCFAGEAQQVSACPTISVSCLSDNCECGPQYEFVATVRGGNPNVQPSYKWTTSCGKIVHGQGTSQIKVEVSESQANSITASVEVLGYDGACANKASVSLICCKLSLPPNKRFSGLAGE